MILQKNIYTVIQVIRCHLVLVTLGLLLSILLLLLMLSSQSSIAQSLSMPNGVTCMASVCTGGNITISDDRCLPNIPSNFSGGHRFDQFVYHTFDSLTITSSGSLTVCGASGNLYMSVTNSFIIHPGGEINLVGKASLERSGARPLWLVALDNAYLDRLYNDSSCTTLETRSGCWYLGGAGGEGGVGGLGGGFVSSWSDGFAEYQDVQDLYGENGSITDFTDNERSNLLSSTSGATGGDGGEGGLILTHGEGGGEVFTNGGRGGVGLLESTVRYDYGGVGGMYGEATSKGLGSGGLFVKAGSFQNRGEIQLYGMSVTDVATIGKRGENALRSTFSGSCASSSFYISKCNTSLANIPEYYRCRSGTLPPGQYLDNEIRAGIGNRRCRTQNVLKKNCNLCRYSASGGPGGYGPGGGGGGGGGGGLFILETADYQNTGELKLQGGEGGSAYSRIKFNEGLLGSELVLRSGATMNMGAERGFDGDTGVHGIIATGYGSACNRNKQGIWNASNGANNDIGLNTRCADHKIVGGGGGGHSGGGGGGGRGQNGVFILIRPNKLDLTNVSFQGTPTSYNDHIHQGEITFVSPDINNNLSIPNNTVACLLETNNSPFVERSDTINTDNVHVFNNLTIGQGAVLTVCDDALSSVTGSGNLNIKVRGDFVNYGTIDLKGKGSDTAPLWIQSTFHVLYSSLAQISTEAGNSVNGGEGGVGIGLVARSNIEEVQLAYSQGGHGGNSRADIHGANVEEYANSGGGGGAGGLPSSRGGDGGRGGRGYKNATQFSDTSFTQEITLSGQGGIGGSSGGSLFLDVDGSFDNQGTISLEGMDGREGEDGGRYSVGSDRPYISKVYLFTGSTSFSRNDFYCEGFHGGGGGSGGGGGGGLVYIQAGEIKNIGNVLVQGGLGAKGGDSFNNIGGSLDLLEGKLVAEHGESPTIQRTALNLASVNTLFDTGCEEGGGGGAGGRGAHGLVYVRKKITDSGNTLVAGEQVVLNARVTQIRDIGPTFNLVVDGIQCLPPFLNSEFPFDREITTPLSDTIDYSGNYHVFNSVTIRYGGILTVCEQGNTESSVPVGYGNIYIKSLNGFSIEEGGKIDLRGRGDVQTNTPNSFLSGTDIIGDYTKHTNFILGATIGLSAPCTLVEFGLENTFILNYSPSPSSSTSNRGGRFLSLGYPRPMATSDENLFSLSNSSCQNLLAISNINDYSPNIISLVGEFGEAGHHGSILYIESLSFLNQGDILLQGTDGGSGFSAPDIRLSNYRQPSLVFKGSGGIGGGGGGGGAFILKTISINSFGVINTEGGNGGNGGPSDSPGLFGASQIRSNHLDVPPNSASGVGGGRGENGPIFIVHQDTNFLSFMKPDADKNEEILFIKECYECLNASNCVIGLYFKGCLQYHYIPLQTQSDAIINYDNLETGYGFGDEFISETSPWLNFDLLSLLQKQTSDLFWLQVTNLRVSNSQQFGVSTAEGSLLDFAIDRVFYEFEGYSYKNYLCLSNSINDCAIGRNNLNTCPSTSVFSGRVDGCSYFTSEVEESEGTETTFASYNWETNSFKNLYAVDPFLIFEMKDGIVQYSLKALDRSGRTYKTGTQYIQVDQYAPCDNLTSHTCFIEVLDTSSMPTDTLYLNGQKTYFLNNLDFQFRINVYEQGIGSGLETGDTNFIFFFLRHKERQLGYYDFSNQDLKQVGTNITTHINLDKTCNTLLADDGEWEFLRTQAFQVSLPSDGRLRLSSSDSLSVLSGDTYSIKDVLTLLLNDEDGSIWFVGCVKDKAGNWSRLINSANSDFIDSNNVHLYEGASLPKMLYTYDSSELSSFYNSRSEISVYLPSFTTQIVVDLKATKDYSSCTDDPCMLDELKGVVVANRASGDSSLNTIAFSPSSYINFLSLSGNSNVIVGVDLPADTSGIAGIWYRIDTLANLNNKDIITSGSLGLNELSLDSFYFLPLSFSDENLCVRVTQDNSIAENTTDVNFCFSVSLTNQDSAICILLEDYSGNITSRCSIGDSYKNLATFLIDYEKPTSVEAVHLDSLEVEDVQTTTSVSPTIEFTPSEDKGGSGMSSYIICYWRTHSRGIVLSDFDQVHILDYYAKLDSSALVCPSSSTVYGNVGSSDRKVFQEPLSYQVNLQTVNQFTPSINLDHGLWRFVVLGVDNADNYSEPTVYNLAVDETASYLVYDTQFSQTVGNADFREGSVSPVRGGPEEYSFRVLYYDFSGYCPSTAEIHIDKNGNGIFDVDEQFSLSPSVCEAKEVVLGKAYYINDVYLDYISSSISCEGIYSSTAGCIYYRFVFSNQKNILLGAATNDQFLFLHPYSHDFKGFMRIHNNVYRSGSQYPTLVVKPTEKAGYKLDLEVLDAKGRHIRWLVNNKIYSVVLEQGYMRWDVRDDRGQLVSSGVYYIRYQYSNKNKSIKKVVIIR